MDLIELARGIGLKPVKAPKEFLDRLGSNHQGLSLLARPKKEPSLSALLDSCPAPKPALILALDHIEDPHNFGALIRSAVAFGALGLVHPKDRSAPLSAAARAASAGGSEVLPLVKVVNLARALEEMKKRNFWVVSAEAGQGQDLVGFDFPDRTVLVLGSEGSGLSRIVAHTTDLMVHIALESKVVDSLNVSNVGAILMHRYRVGLAEK
jgi:23S rRNA (guanosine2251-2'-O)-methyltransferase